MKKDLWTKLSFFIADIPAWKCPYCGEGLLLLEKGNLLKIESQKSITARPQSILDWVPESEFGKFSCLFTCSNPKCGENVSCGGNYRERYFETLDGHSVYPDEFYPKFFYDPPHIIEIPDRCPISVKERIMVAFGLFWYDAPACANRIRQAVEALLNEHSVSKTCTLHRRIEIFGNSQKDCLELLMAVKWIGNEGSHDGNLTRDDILDGFAIIESVLTQLYDQTRQELNKVVYEINRKKGVRSK